jgi:hypothetical protein
MEVKPNREIQSRLLKCFTTFYYGCASKDKHDGALGSKVE